jgi:glycosyltransferase involved in cell wall biosynthesis
LDDNPESLTRKQLQHLVSSGVVDYLGSVQDVKPLLEKHQVLVLPSYREGTPRAVLEAMSLGMPIITTDAPGCRETVRDGVNGYLAKLRDVQSLAQCMLKMIGNQNLAQTFGSKSREMAVEKYDVKLVVNDIFKAMFPEGQGGV